MVGKSVDAVGQAVVGNIHHDIDIFAADGFSDFTFCLAASEARAPAVQQVGCGVIAAEVEILLAADKDFRIILPELDNMSVHFFGKIPAAVQCSQFQRRNGKGIIKYIFFRHFGPPGVM